MLMWWTVAVVLLVASGLFYIAYGNPQTNTEEEVPAVQFQAAAPRNDTREVDQELQSIQTDNLGSELGDIQKELGK